MPRSGNVDPSLVIGRGFGECPDFKGGKTALEFLMEKRGHRLLMSPKFHLGLVGVGIEYSGKEYDGVLAQDKRRLKQPKGQRTEGSEYGRYRDGTSLLPSRETYSGLLPRERDFEQARGRDDEECVAGKR